MLWFLLIGLFVKYLYIHSAGGFLSTVAYVMATPVLMIATRGDLSIVMSQFTKHVALPLLLIAAVGRLLSTRTQFRRWVPRIASGRAGFSTKSLDPVHQLIVPDSTLAGYEYSDFRQH